MKINAKRVITIFLSAILLFCTCTAVPAEAMTKSIYINSTVQDNKSIKLSWKKKNASGYYIYRANVDKNGNYGKYRRIATIAGNRTSYTDKRVQYKKSYSYEVKGYKRSGKKIKYIYSGSAENTVDLGMVDWSEGYPFDARVTPECIPLEIVAYDGFVPKGFEIYRANADESGKRTGKWRLLKNVNNSKREMYICYKDKAVSTKRSYQYKVRSYKTINKKKVYSKYSDAITLSAVNQTGGFDVNADIDADKPARSIVVSLTADENNAASVLLDNFSYPIELSTLKSSEEDYCNVEMKLVQYSYDNINWQRARGDYKINIAPQGTVYLKFEVVEENEYLVFSDDLQECTISTLYGKYGRYYSLLHIDLNKGRAKFLLDGEAYH